MIMTKEILKIMKKPQPSNFDMCAECWQTGEDSEREKIIKLLKKFEKNIIEPETTGYLKYQFEEYFKNYIK